MSVSTVQTNQPSAVSTAGSGYADRKSSDQAPYPRLVGEKRTDQLDGTHKPLSADQIDSFAEVDANYPEDAPLPRPADRFDSGEFAQLFDAVIEGDADTANAMLEALKSAAQQAVYGPGGASSAVPGMLRRDLQALLSAVSASNVAAARQALARLQSTVQNS
jgi:hypothetical protein